MINPRLTFRLIFILCVIPRLLYYWFAGTPADGFGEDSYIRLSEQVTNGNFDFDVGRFIMAPLYPIFLGIIRLITGDLWINIVSFIQIALSAAAGVYLYRTARLLFPNPLVGIISVVIYAIYFPIFYYCYAITTETLYQFLLIYSIYRLVEYVSAKEQISLIHFAVAFSLAALTKSFILFFLPFAIVIIWLATPRKKLKSTLLFVLIWGISTLPFGLHNLKTHDVYTLSSNGAGFHFYNANSAYGFADAVGQLDTEEESTLIKHLSDSVYKSMYKDEVANEIFGLPVAQRQKAFFNYSWKYSKDHPSQFFQAKLANTVRFIIPGVSPRHHSIKTFLLALLFGLPLYMLGYYGFFLSIKKDWKRHLYMIGLFVCMAAVLILFLFTNRYRVYTLEPFLILYAAYGLITLVAKRMEGYVKNKFESFNQTIDVDFETVYEEKTD